MSTEARNLNLFPSHLLRIGEIKNPALENDISNIHNYSIDMMVMGDKGGIPPTSKSTFPLQDIQFENAALQHLTKTMNNQEMNLLQLKEKNGLTFNNNNSTHPFSRKRPREQVSIDGFTIANNRNDNNGLVSMPNEFAAKIFSDKELGTVSFLGRDWWMEMMQHKVVFDQLISLHMDKIRSEIEHMHRKESNRLFGTFDEAISKKLRNKDEHIARIGKLNFALHEQAKSLYVENQMWQDLARTHKVVINALQSNLNQVLEQTNNTKQVQYGEDEAESNCGSNNDASEGIRDEALIPRWKKVVGMSNKDDRKPVAVEEGKRRKWMCRKCGKAERNVLVLSCRHLCLCQACGSSIDTCPVCNSTMKANIHVTFS